MESTKKKRVMTKKKLDTWLPIFWPGEYGTITYQIKISCRY